MNRDAMVERLVRSHEAGQDEPWELLVVGGGATGLGIAIDAAARGYRTLLVERLDFAHGTSSRSTKLAHGGVRYLQQGNVSLVLEALHERGLMRQNAPHLVSDLPFIVPNYEWWEAPFYGVGLKLYDMLAGKLGFGKSRHLSLEETVEHIPELERDGLRGGTLYYDGQFDDARLAVGMARTAAGLGATLVNYCDVTGLVHEDGLVRAVQLTDVESGREMTVFAKVVINATGAFADTVRTLDDAAAKPMIRPSQGVHIVLDGSFLGGKSAIMVPHTDDGRVLFAIPWYGRVVVGTTDTPIPATPIEPLPFEEELEFLITHAARYLEKDPTRADVLSCYAGVRPLVGSIDDDDSKAISRDHTIHISGTGLLTIAGGKWTTYRKMAQDVVDQAAALGGLETRPCVTADLRIAGYHTDSSRFGVLQCYGGDAPAIQDLLATSSSLAEPLHPNLRPLAGEVLWAVREEMARTVEDFLSRRTRSLVLDARASLEMAPRVAELMARELGRDRAWEEAQVAAYRDLASGYLLDQPS